MKRTIVMLGTDPRGQGGIAAIADQYVALKSRFAFPLLYLSTHRAGSKFTLLSTFVVSASRLLALLLLRRVLLVHVHCASRGSFFRKSLLLALARLFSVPTVLHLHGGGFAEFYSGVRSRWLRSWIAHSFQRSSKVIVLSESWQGRITAIAPGARMMVLPNAVATARSDNPKPAPFASPGRDNKPSYPLILFAGRIERLKGVEDLVRALPLILDKFPDAMLVFAGAGEIPSLQALIRALQVQKNVTLLDWVSSQTLDSHYRACTMFALPSYAEGLPMAMLEAMAHGKPIVVSPVGGIPEALKHMESALFVQPGAENEIAGAIIELACDPKLAQRLGSEAKRRVRERYGIAEHFEKLNHLYLNLIAIKP